MIFSGEAKVCGEMVPGQGSGHWHLAGSTGPSSQNISRQESHQGELFFKDIL